MYKQDFRDGRGRPATPTRACPLPPEDPSLYPLFIKYLSSRYLSASLATRNKWYPSTWDGVPRVVIPATTAANTWPYFQARAMNDHPIRYRSPAVPRGDALILIQPESEPEGVCIVEGPMDALAAASCGFVGIGLMGNTPPMPVIQHLVTLLDLYGQDRCYLIPDNDAFAEAQALAGTLWQRGVTCYVKPLTGFKDLAAMPEERRTRWFLSLTN